MASSILHRTIIVVLALTILPVSGWTGDQVYPDSATTEQLIQVQRYLFNDNFDAADSLADVMMDERPNDPSGFFCAGVATLVRMFDAESKEGSEQFHRFMDSSESLAQSGTHTRDSNYVAWNYYFLANTISYRAMWKAKFGSPFLALRAAVKAKGFYERGLEHDSTVTDLYLGLGLFHYWKSVKAGILRRIGIFHNDIDRGIEEIYLAAANSAVSREAARNALVWVWLDRKEYDSVLVIGAEMENAYPEGKTFLWPMAEAYEELGRHEEAVCTYERIRTLLLEQPGNYYNLIECDFRIVRGLEKLDLDAEAGLSAARSNDYNDLIAKDIGKKQKNKISYLEKRAIHPSIPRSVAPCEAARRSVDSLPSESTR